MILGVFLIGVGLVMLWALVAILISRRNPDVFSRWHGDE